MVRYISTCKTSGSWTQQVFAVMVKIYSIDNLYFDNLYLCVQVANFVDEAVKIAQKYRTAFGPKLKDFKDHLSKQVRGNDDGV